MIMLCLFEENSVGILLICQDLFRSSDLSDLQMKAFFLAVSY